MQHQFGADLLNFKEHVDATYRFNISLKHVPATFSCVCKCCNFVSATYPRYTTLTRFTSVCTTHLFVAGTCRCSMSLQRSLHDRRFMSQAGRTRYFAWSATRARSARRGGELALVSRSARNIAFALLGS